MAPPSCNLTAATCLAHLRGATVYSLLLLHAGRLTTVGDPVLGARISYLLLGDLTAATCLARLRGAIVYRLLLLHAARCITLGVPVWGAVAAVTSPQPQLDQKIIQFLCYKHTFPMISTCPVLTVVFMRRDGCDSLDSHIEVGVPDGVRKTCCEAARQHHVGVDV